MQSQLTRRQLILTTIAVATWPDLSSAQPNSLETLDPETASEIAALTNQILPSTDGPGAHEAGVIYFIDHALTTFAKDDLETYRKGLADLQKTRRMLFPQSTTIASLTAQQQITIIKSFETSPFFELLRTHTVLGFLGDPSYGGNKNKIGWHQVGFEDRMMWQHPFGYYDSGAEQS